MNSGVGWLWLQKYQPGEAVVGRQTAVIVFAAINLLVILLFPPFENYASMTRLSGTYFDGFYFVFGDKWQRRFYVPLLYLEILWALVNSALQITVGVSQSAIIRMSALTARKNFHIQLLNSRSQLMNYAAIYARRSGNTLYMGDLGSTADGVRPSKPRMYRQTAGSYASLGFGTFSAVSNTSHRLTFSVLGNSHQLWAEGVLQVSATDATVANDINGNFSLNAYGQNAVGTIRFDDVVVCSARSVSINGLPNGHKLRIVNVVSLSAMNGGAVSVDVLAAQLPMAQIEILDGANVVVKRYSPTDGVWGGDVYTLNPVQ